LTTLITGASIASKADAAGLNLLPPGLQSIKDGVDKRKGIEAPAVEQGSKIPKFEAPKFEAPSFSVPKLGPQRKSETEAADGADGAEEPKKSRMTMPKFG